MSKLAARGWYNSKHNYLLSPPTLHYNRTLTDPVKEPLKEHFKKPCLLRPDPPSIV